MPTHKKQQAINIFILFSLSLVFCSDLFLSKSQPQTFDQPTHVTTIAQFTQVLKQGEFPVIWVDKFANYGYPLGLFAQQIPAYFGAFINFVISDPLISYNLLIFIGSFLISLFFYLFLNDYFKPRISLISSSLLNFSAYKIINVFIRGALPEYFSLIFLILALLSLNHIFFKQNKLGFFSLTLAFTFILLTHPMMFVIYLPIIFLYFVFISPKFNLKKLLLFFVPVIIAIILSSYYLLPLKLENKYFVMGNHTSQVNTEQFLTWTNYFSHNWYYFLTHPGPRGNFIKFGLIESLICLIAVVIFKFYRFKQNQKSLFLFSLVSFGALFFLTISFSKFIYQLPFIREIQYPWRILSPLSIFPSIFLAFILNRFNSSTISLSIFFLILIFRLPQVYTKNTIAFDSFRYNFTAYNLHIKDLTLNWIGEPSSYEFKNQKVEIIDGVGHIKNLRIRNSSRTFKINSNQDLRLADNTFYFPGWNVYIDNIKTDIEYQDPNYRGVITYQVPAGEHQIKVIFENTKIRQFSQYLSVIGLILFLFLFVNHKKLPI